MKNFLEFVNESSSKAPRAFLLDDMWEDAGIRTDNPKEFLDNGKLRLLLDLAVFLLKPNKRSDVVMLESNEHDRFVIPEMDNWVYSASHKNYEVDDKNSVANHPENKDSVYVMINGVDYLTFSIETFERRMLEHMNLYLENLVKSEIGPAVLKEMMPFFSFKFKKALHEYRGLLAAGNYDV